MSGGAGAPRRFGAPALQEQSLHIMVSRDIPDGAALLADFHEGLVEIRSDGTHGRILEEMGYR